MMTGGWGTGVAVISSDCPRGHTACNRPFSGSDEGPGPEAGGPAGSCIVSVGWWYWENLGTGGPLSTESQFQM